MTPQHYSIALIEIDRVMRDIVEGAGPGSSRDVFNSEREQPQTGRAAAARQSVGAAMIRLGERLRGAAPQPDAACS